MKRRGSLLFVAIALLMVAVVASLLIGSNHLSLSEIWRQLVDPDDSAATAVVRDLRVPRTVLGVLVGAALGVGGSLMQSMTRNPLGDPGVLGINAGAGLAVVAVVALTGTASISAYVWFAFAGAGFATVVVSVLGGLGGSRTVPQRLALAGVALSAAISSLIQVVILADQHTFNEFRFWAAGSLEGRGWSVLATVWPFILVGVVGAALLAPRLNALALGDDASTSLGLDVRRTRVLAMTMIALLCGAATAAAGPIAFVGLGVPYVARWLVGSDERWALPYSVLLGATTLLGADVIGRVLVADEVQVGIVTAILGGPVFVAIVRRPAVRSL